jgi:hypothetical protein
MTPWRVVYTAFISIETVTPQILENTGRESEYSLDILVPQKSGMLKLFNIIFISPITSPKGKPFQ